ncbi:hypothetical protein QE152_g32053 [Popillia japonica]|uniref:Uncharacterized protein n=1 Tax=Popillia japonica TaxID=7064 RepID=A0AAW1J066_POPJA
MSTPTDLNLVENLTLDELLRHMEEDEFEGNGEININIMPPIRANEDLTDEDSGDGDIMSINNLPASQFYFRRWR